MILQDSKACITCVGFAGFLPARLRRCCGWMECLHRRASHNVPYYSALHKDLNLNSQISQHYVSLTCLKTAAHNSLCSLLVSKQIFSWQAGQVNPFVPNEDEGIMNRNCFRKHHRPACLHHIYTGLSAIARGTVPRSARRPCLAKRQLLSAL